jgi:3',5'-nucleoside bisphosphate phosphatase
MGVDLHCHSVASDGSETPSEVIRRAAVAGLDAVALTDHDVLEGLAEAGEAAARHDVELIPGTELSLDWSGIDPAADQRGGMHLIVLWIDDGPGPLQDRLADLRLGRERRNHTILERLAQLGLDVPMSEVMARAGSGSVGRPHIAGVMVDRLYVPDIATAFSEYLAHGRPAYVPRARLDPGTALRLGRASGGVPVLAHPHTLGFEHDPDLEALLRHLAGLGLMGVETDHSASETPRRRALRRMADRVGLSRSGGSDYHGSYKPGIEVGVGVGDLDVPTAYLDELRSRREQAG